MSDKNIINRWNTMANADLGIDRVAEAKEFARLFEEVLEKGNTQIEGLKWALPILRGIAINNRDALDLDVVETLDLSFVQINVETARELDDILMWDMNWKMRYDFAMGR